MITTPSMGLKRWDQPNDVFSYTELSDNFNLLDAHDHSTGKGVQIPTGGIANLAVDGTKIANNAIDASKIATDAVTAIKIPNASVTDAKLASPNNAVWRNLGQATAILGGGAGNATYVLGPNGILASGTSGTTPMLVIPFNPTVYAVAGKTTTMRLLTNVTANGTVSVVTITFGLYPISSAGGNVGSVSYTLGTVVAGSTVAYVNPAINTHVANASGDFAAPANGNYMLGFTTSATLAANATYGLQVFLQIKHV
jgi:hypothetical protein